MIKVMIVEDDPMVAEFNKRYLNQVDGYELAAVCSSVDRALNVLEDRKNRVSSIRHFHAWEKWTRFTLANSRK